jgi:hypothetical protein
VDVRIAGPAAARGTPGTAPGLSLVPRPQDGRDGGRAGVNSGRRSRARGHHPALSNVDCAKQFYKCLGRWEGADIVGGPTFRIVIPHTRRSGSCAQSGREAAPWSARSSSKPLSRRRSFTSRAARRPRPAIHSPTSAERLRTSYNPSAAESWSGSWDELPNTGVNEDAQDVESDKPACSRSQSAFG